MTPLYDTIGISYRDYRRPDPRIAAMVNAAIGDAVTVVNVGAGSGSYEPRDRRVVAVEPSRVMIAQRAPGSGAAVQADAEALPFADGSFDCAMAMLTIHHWGDVERGVRELVRVANGHVVLLTWAGFGQHFWLMDYLPEIATVDVDLFPTAEQLTAWIGPLRVSTVPVPHDCTDGFLCAYWRRPEAYLDPGARRAISIFSHGIDVSVGLARLASDLSSGAWHARYGELLEREEMDYGYRLVMSATRGRRRSAPSIPSSRRKPGSR